MLVKIITLFLLAMLLVGMIGKVLYPGAISRTVRKKLSPTTCKRCGRYRIGKGDCDCSRKG